MTDTEPIAELRGTIRVQEHGRDPLRGLLLLDAFLLACLAGLWAIWTHREWIRAVDAAIVVLAVLEFARLLFSPKD